MKLNISFIIVICVFLITSCYNNWEEHYEIYAETVNENVWDAMNRDSEISDFVQILKDNKYDTLFLSDIPYTLFVPSNKALAQFKSENKVDKSFIEYHISSNFIQSGSVVGKRYIQTLTEKFAMFERYGGELKMDGILLKNESPLFKNGKYFVMDQVAKPLPNLYEYFMVNNPLLIEYINSQDSLILDRERSKPIGFDELGNTIFDSITIGYNKFEAEFFPVSKEFRNQTATIVFPKKEDYEEALTSMVHEMNIPTFIDYRDVPIEWQHEVLVPYLLKQGVFENMLEPEAFAWKSEDDTLKLKNILGDSIQILYSPAEKTICSNGYVYNYNNFNIPDTLHSGTTKFEAEWLLAETGIGKFAWNTKANVQSDRFFAPLQEYISTASNDSIARVLFPKGYNGKYSLEFKTNYLFPRKYIMIVKTQMYIGGVYDIYVNDELIKTFDYYDFVRYKTLIPSVTGGRYFPNGNFNSYDMWVDNINEYSRAKIRFEYKGPGRVFNNGLVIDYVEFVPVVN